MSSMQLSLLLRLDGDRRDDDMMYCIVENN